MKKICIIFSGLLFTIFGHVHAQVGIGTDSPNQHAVLQLTSPGNNQGLILPSLTTSQRTSATFTNQLTASENGLLVYDKDENKFYYWQNTAWQIMLSGTIANGATGPASGDLTGSYPAPQIAAGAVGSAELANNAVVTASLAAGSVTDIKIASIAPSKLSAGGAATGQVLKWSGTNWTAQADNAGTGTITNIATGAGLTGGPITTSGTLSLADNGVTTIKIIDGAVTSAKILDASIATADLANNSVTDANVSSVSPAKLTASGATNGQVLKWNGASWVPQADNVGGSGTVTNVATAGGLTGGPITASGSISIADGGVTSLKIADGAILNADINTAAGIVDSKLATITAAGKVSGNAITSGTIGGTTAVNTSGNIVTTGLVTATNATSGSVITSSNSITGGYAVSGSSTSTDGGGGILGTGTGITVGRVTTYSYGVRGSNSFSGAYGWIGGGEGVYGNNVSGTGVAGEGYYGLSGSGSFIGVIGSAPAVAGNYGVYSSGQAGGTTTWAAISDVRFKKNIVPLSASLAAIVKLRGVSYDWRTDEFPDKNFKTTRDIGVIAQEALSVIPEVVVQDREGFYAVSYEKIVPVLIEAIKELEQKIRKLEEENVTLLDLKQRLETLEALLPVSSGKKTNGE